jgi:hypothetical protein
MILEEIEDIHGETSISVVDMSVYIEQHADCIVIEKSNLSALIEALTKVNQTK